MAKFGINDIIDIRNNTCVAGTVNEYKEIWMNPKDVKPADSNFYSQEDIEELADSFLTVGQQQPTVLARIDGEFYIVSGHRRNLANIKNLERGYEEYAKVRYLYKDMTPSMFELSLLVGNAYNRELTAWEKTQQAKRLKEALLRAKKEDGIEIKGKMRNLIANLMNESTSNIAKMDSINHNAVQEIQDELKNGNLGISAAYETAKLPPEEQKAIAKKTAVGENISVKEIAEKCKEEKDARSKSGLEEKTAAKTNQKENLPKVFESNTLQSQAEGKKPFSELPRTEKRFLHQKILREWENQDIQISNAAKKVSNAINRVFDSNTFPKSNWKDMEWTIFLAKAIMYCADRVSEEDLYLLHDIMMRCQKKEKEKGK